MQGLGARVVTALMHMDITIPPFPTDGIGLLDSRSYLCLHAKSGVASPPPRTLRSASNSLSHCDEPIPTYLHDPACWTDP
eukprot:2746384-Pleurochrysis_carterae.AAC.1